MVDDHLRFVGCPSLLCWVIVQGWWVTVVGMVGAHPCYGGRPSMGWWVTKLSRRWWVTVLEIVGGWLTVLRMVGECPKDGV